MSSAHKGIKIESIIALYHRGFTLSEIGDELGCSDVNIVNRLKSIGLYNREEIRRRATEKMREWMNEHNPVKRPEVRKKIAKTLKGHKVSEDTRRKMAEKIKELHRKGLFHFKPNMNLGYIGKDILKRWRRNYPEMAREVSRKTRLNQVFPKEDTKIEIKLQRLLDEMRIPYQTHYQVVGQPDLAILNLKKKVAIFADGCYWHCCPKHFPEAKSKAQKRRVHARIARDKEVNRNLGEKGWIVLRFWGHEIEENFEEVKQRIN